MKSFLRTSIEELMDDCGSPERGIEVRQIAGGYEYVLLVLAATLALALTGPGRLSVDELRARGLRVEIP